MREWSLTAGDPLSLGLASDARLEPPDYCNDHIWELKLGDGDPPAIAVETTYGLRARIMRMFPLFKEGETGITDPADFARAPAIHRFFPNYLLYTFSPFPAIDVIGELWVPDSQTLSGRLRIQNHGVTPRNARLDWVALLTPGDTGQRFSPEKMGGVTVLRGETAGLNPVVFMTGGPQPTTSPFPALSHEFDLLPGGEAQVIWTQAAAETPERSFEMARDLAARNWEAETAKLEMMNSAIIDIKTGDPDWDAAFALGQKVAFGLVHGPSEHLPYPSFVQNRTPDQGFSLRGDGGDYDYLWNGQSPLETWYLARLLLPAAPELVKGFLRNFLVIQNEFGYVDWKPGLAGQRTRLDATPLLAHLALEIYRTTGDQSFLEELFPDLLTFFLGWFSPYHDEDQDGIPEWDRLDQSGFDNSLTFSHWLPESLGVDIKMCETPSLNAFLINEGESLIEIAAIIDQPDPQEAIKQQLMVLRENLDRVWDDQEKTYRFRDRDTHDTPSGKVLMEAVGPGVKPIRETLSSACRPQVRIEATSPGPRWVSIRLKGLKSDGEAVAVQLKPDTLHWHEGIGLGTSPVVFQKLTEIEFEGVEPKDRVLAQIVNLQNEEMTQMLPLWAAAPEENKARALIRGTLTNPIEYWRPFGIPTQPGQIIGGKSTASASVSLPWNELLGTGLLRFGFRGLAADLVARLMRAIIGTLKREQAFRSRYHAETGQGLGERNSLTGLPPLGLFLDTLGIRLISPWKVGLEGVNPYPWPVEVKYRGLTVKRGKIETQVTFPDEQTVTVTDPKACIVEKSGPDSANSASSP
jgi:hypothetical protein